MVAFASTDDAGVPYLCVGDFLRLGLAFEAVVYALTSTAGFELFARTLRGVCPDGQSASALLH